MGYDLPMLVIFFMMLAAVVTGHTVWYVSGRVAVKMGYAPKVGHDVAASCGLSLIATPRKRT